MPDHPVLRPDGEAIHVPAALQGLPRRGLGEVSLVARLFVRNSNSTNPPGLHRHWIFPSLHRLLPAQSLSAKWKYALRKEASKWGLAITMIAFTLTLRDRLAEILAGASFLLWLALNLSDFRRPSAPDRNA